MISRLHLLRFVERDSIIHRAGARSKVVLMIGMVFGLSFNPVWASVGIVWCVVVLGIVVARLPFSVVPRPPRPLLAAMCISLTFGLLSGGEPFVELAASEVGLGGLLLQIRIFGLTLGLFGLTLLTGWTTRAADLATAAGWTLGPLARVGVPTGEIVAALALAVRALPLIANEFSIVAAMARTEPPGRSAVERGMAVLSTTAVATVRRATEFGQSIEARGPIVVSSAHQPWNRWDAIVLATGVALTTLIALA